MAELELRPGVPQVRRQGLQLPDDNRFPTSGQSLFPASGEAPADTLHDHGQVLGGELGLEIIIQSEAIIRVR